MTELPDANDAFLNEPVTFRVRDAISLREARKDLAELRADFNRWAVAGFGALVAGFGGVIVTLIALH